MICFQRIYIELSLFLQPHLQNEKKTGFNILRNFAKHFYWKQKR